MGNGKWLMISAGSVASFEHRTMTPDRLMLGGEAARERFYAASSTDANPVSEGTSDQEVAED